MAIKRYEKHVTRRNTLGSTKRIIYSHVFFMIVSENFVLFVHISKKYDLLCIVGLTTELQHEQRS